jgi:hypothetical protein
MRVSDSTISSPDACGVPPPTSPVLPPCGTDRRARVGARGDDRRDFGGRGGTHDRERLAAIAAAPIGRVRGDVAGSRQDMVGADDGGKPREQGCAGVRHGPAY